MFELYYLFTLIPVIVFVVVTVMIIVNVVKKGGFKIPTSIDEDIITNVKESLEKIKNPKKQAKHCEYCGSQLQDDETKCSSCGASITKK